MSRCDKCSFYKESTPTSRREGTCRRYPPVVPDRYTLWPMVNYDDWCGEFKPKEKEKEVSNGS